MRVGLFFGSFNPVHYGHLIIASHVLNEYDLQKVWFVVSPQNPFKETSSLLNENHRKYLVDLAIEDDDRLQVSSIEFQLPRPSYTIDTLVHLEERYPHHEFTLIVGSDSFQNIPNWKNGEILLKNYKLIVYERPGFSVDTIKTDSNITVTKAPMLDISSTHIRTLIKERKSIKYLVPEKVREEIDIQQFYF